MHWPMGSRPGRIPHGTRIHATWTTSYRWKKLYGIEFRYAGPLFIHQLSHVWIDFRAIQDDGMRGRGLDYFQLVRHAQARGLTPRAV
jgi:hypothetical protein